MILPCETVLVAALRHPFRAQTKTFPGVWITESKDGREQIPHRGKRGHAQQDRLASTVPVLLGGLMWAQGSESLVGQLLPLEPTHL